MQSLSIWSLKGKTFTVPHLNSNLGSSCTAKRKRRRKKGCEFGDYFGRTVHNSLFLNNSREPRSFNCISFCHQSQHTVPECGFFSHYSKLDLCGAYNGKISSCRASVGLVLALEQEAIGGELRQGMSDSTNEFRERLEGVKLDQEDNSKILVSDIEEIEVEQKQTVESELSEEGRSRIDVRALACSLRFAKTAEDVEEVLKDLEELPLPVYSSMIKGFGIEKQLDSAFALVEWLKKHKERTNGSVGPNLFIYNSLLGALKQSEHFEQVDKVMEDMKAQGIVPNVVTYNTLMIIYLEKGQPKRALDFLHKIPEMGLVPSPVSYSTALLAYRRLEDVEGALRLFVNTRELYQKGEIGKDTEEDWENELIKLENFTTRICYQVMRRWLVKGEHLITNVMKLLNDMDKAGLCPGRSDYEKLVWACTLGGHYPVARELYRRLRERESEISLSVCNHVIWLMGKAKKWWVALEIYEDLLDRGPKPNNLSYELIVSHFNILLTAARRRGIWRWGVRLINKMQDKGLKPGSREWNAVLLACSKASETSAAVQIFRRMVEQGEKPTIISYGALLSALEKGNMYDEALQVWDHMCKVGAKPNLYAYTILVSVRIGQGQDEKVDEVIHEMRSCGVEPSVVTFNAIISGCTKKGMGGAAFEWFHRMKAQNITPNEITYQMLIDALARDGKPRLAYEMYLQACNEGLQLSSKAYDIVIESARHYRASIDTSTLGPRPPEPKRTRQTRKTLSEFCDLANVPRRSKPFNKEEIYPPHKVENNS